MKTIKIVLLSLITLALLVACGGKKETVTICEGEIVGIPGASGTAEYHAVGDEIISYKTVQNIPYESFGTDDKELVKAAMDEVSENFDLSDNVNYDYDYTDDTFIATMELKDIKTASSEEIEFVGLIIEPGTKISLKLTIDNQENTTKMVCTTSDKE